MDMIANAPFRIAIPGPADLAAAWPVPPCSGNWRRLPDGGLMPEDDATAAGAGLLVQPPPAEHSGIAQTTEA